MVEITDTVGRALSGTRNLQVEETIHRAAIASDIFHTVPVDEIPLLFGAEYAGASPAADMSTQCELSAEPRPRPDAVPPELCLQLQQEQQRLSALLVAGQVDLNKQCPGRRAI